MWVRVGSIRFFSKEGWCDVVGDLGGFVSFIVGLFVISRIIGSECYSRIWR